MDNGSYIGMVCTYVSVANKIHNYIETYVCRCANSFTEAQLPSPAICSRQIGGMI